MPCAPRTCTEGAATSAARRAAPSGWTGASCSTFAATTISVSLAISASPRRSSRPSNDGAWGPERRTWFAATPRRTRNSNRTLAEFTGRPRALVYSSGYAANVGVINALLSVDDLVCEDRLNHASLLDGGWISRARFAWYAHLDCDDLDRQLARDANRKLIVSDGTFSMDGDRCRLDELIAVARRRDAWVMIDDAHGMGVHGAEGVGLVDPGRYSIDDVQVLVGTFGKALGTSGAFVAGSEALIETLIQRSRNYIYTTAMPPALAVATLASLAIARAEAWRRDRLDALIERFRKGAARLGFNLPESASPIQPLIVGDPQAALDMSRGLEERGCLCTAIRPPSVPEGTSRLRITLTAAHTDADVDRLLGALEDIRKAPHEGVASSTV